MKQHEAGVAVAVHQGHVEGPWTIFVALIDLCLAVDHEHVHKAGDPLDCGFGT